MDLTRITQIAWARLLPNEQVPQHRHPDMDECFFFTKGSGEIIVDEVKYELAEGVFLIIPAGGSHSLYCTGETLEFFYFGLQVYG